MYRALLFIYSLVFLCGTTHAGKVSETQALAKARLFMQGKQIRQNLRRAAVTDAANKHAYYVFNVENNNGFVIVAGDDRLPEILGYSDRGNVQQGDMPCNMKWLMDCYANTIDSLDAKGITQVYAPRRTGAMKTIEPLVTTQWGQGAPYNSMCPEIDGQRCLTGCVATAMAQIINYKKWPQGQTSKVDAYASFGIPMAELAPTTFDWDHMTDDDVARLMLYCGQAAQTNYGVKASGADIPENAFKYVFGYSKSLYNWLGKLFTAEHLEQHVYNELVENRPVFYTGSNATEGHAFVVDGYKDGMFHINWGWDGRNDGYFVQTATTEDVMPYPFSYNTYLLMGIEAASTDASQAKVIARNCKYESRCSYRKSVSDDFAYTTTFKSKLVCDLDDVSCYVGFGLYNEQGLFKVLGQQKVTLPHNLNYRDGIGSDIPVGTYDVVPIYRHQESDEWKKVEGSNQWHFTLHVGEQIYYIEDPVDEWNGNYVNYGIHEIDGVTYLLEREFINWAHALPYQINGKYSGDVVIPNQVEYDGKMFSVSGVNVPAFDDCENLTSLSLGVDNNVQIFNCPNLSQIELKQGQQISISFCPKLESIVFPVTMEWVFVQHCQNLKTMRFNSTRLNFSVVEWDENIFPSLTDIYFSTAIPPNVDMMGQPNSHATIHVPKGCLQDYQTSQWAQWKLVDDQTPPFVTWGYCHGDKITTYGMVIGTRGGDNNDELAMRVAPEDLQAYKGAKITHVQVYSPSRAVNDWGYENYEYVFVTKRGTDYLAKQPFQVIRGAWNTVKFDEPYTITGEELFVGIGRHGQIGVTYSDMTFVPDALWGRFMGDDHSASVTLGAWDYVRECPLREGPSGIYAHPIPLRFAIEGEGMPEGVVIRELELPGEYSEDEAPSYAAASHRALGATNTIQGVIRNRSKDLVSSYTLEWTIDGGEKQVRTIETHLLPNATETITIDLPQLANGIHAVSTNITMVNNSANELDGLNMPTIYLLVDNGTISETTGVDVINNTKDAVFHPVVYDLQGRRVKSMSKGFYIVGGKKVVVK